MHDIHNTYFCTNRTLKAVYYSGGAISDVTLMHEKRRDQWSGTWFQLQVHLPTTLKRASPLGWG